MAIYIVRPCWLITGSESIASEKNIPVIKVHSTQINDNENVPAGKPGSARHRYIYNNRMGVTIIIEWVSQLIFCIESFSSRYDWKSDFSITLLLLSGPIGNRTNL